MKRAARKFTGYHMTAILLAFFGVVIAVNVVMATYAVRTFGGTVVDNSYVASQKFNSWLAEARREEKLGWQVSDIARDGDRLVLSLSDAQGAPIAGAAVAVRAEHPLGRAPERDLAFREVRPGGYESIGALPAGRWKLRVSIRRAHEERDMAPEIF